MRDASLQDVLLQDDTPAGLQCRSMSRVALNAHLDQYPHYPALNLIWHPRPDLKLYMGGYAAATAVDVAKVVGVNVVLDFEEICSQCRAPLDRLLYCKYMFCLPSSLLLGKFGKHSCVIFLVDPL